MIRTIIIWILQFISILTSQVNTEAMRSAENKDGFQNKFNLEIHPKILSYLVTSIQHVTKSLQSNSGNKSKEEIKNESNLYDDLRKKMSTKEFIEQYAAGLK